MSKEAEFRKMNECFVKCEEIRAQHLLWEDFQKERTDLKGSGVYKMAFYVLLGRNELQADRGKDEKGNFGYGLKYVEKSNLLKSKV